MAQTAITESSNYNRRPVCQVKVDWNKDGDFSDTSEDVTAYVQSIKLTSEAVSRSVDNTTVGASIADKATVVLSNATGIFSRNQAGTVTSSNAGYLCPITIELGFVTGGGNEYRIQFTGVVIAPSEQVRDQTVTLECLDRWALLKGKRISTPLYRNKRVDEIISLWNAASGFGYTAYLERSSRIISVAWLEDDSVAEDLIRLIEADGGICFFGKDGTLRYFDATWPARNTSSVYTFTTAKFADIEPVLDFNSIYDEVVVKVRPRYPALQDVLWSADEEVMVEAGAGSGAPGAPDALDLRVVFRNPAYALALPVYSTKPDESDWIAVSGAGQLLESGGTSQVSVSVLNAAEDDVFFTYGWQDATPEAQSVTLRLTNANTSHRAYLPKLQIRGNPVVSGKDVEVSADNGGTITRILSIDNIYVQNREHGLAIARSRRYKHRNPRETIVLRGVPGQPHLEVFDRVTVTETAQSGIGSGGAGTSDYFIAKIESRFSPSDGYSQDYELVKASGETPSTTYFRIGASPLDGSAVSWY